MGAALLAWGIALPAAALHIEYVAVRDPGNAPDTATNCLNDAPDCGSVAYDYAISRYEITNSEYAQFLNEVANEVDTYALYNPAMAIDFPPVPMGFERFYVVQAGFENLPVVHVSFWDVLRFANWLHNGQPRGLQDETTTEDGAYTITPAAVAAGEPIARNMGAQSFVPTENEWYKAAFYDPGDGIRPGIYYDYPAGTDAPTTCTTTPTAEPNTANCDHDEGGLTSVGSYTGSPSPFGTFDQGGNVWEWNETANIRGGSYFNHIDFIAAAAPRPDALLPSEEFHSVGFRVARLVPEPAQVLLLLTGGLVLAVARRLRA